MSTKVNAGMVAREALKSVGREIQSAAQQAGLDGGTAAALLKVAGAGANLFRAGLQHDPAGAAQARQQLAGAVDSLVSDAKVQDFGHHLATGATAQRLAEAPLPGAFRSMVDGLAHKATARMGVAKALLELGLPANHTGPISLRELYADPSKHAAADKLLDVYFGEAADPIVGKPATGFLASFPDPDEVQPKATLRKYLMDPEDTWSISVQLKDGKVAGGVNYNVLETEKGETYGVLEHLWVDGAQRRQGQGTAITEGVLAQMRETAPDMKGVFIETNDPRLMSPDKLKDEPVDPNGRLSFWKKMGFQAVDHRYIQPALSDEQSAVDHLILAYRPLTPAAEGEQAPRSIEANVVRDFCKAYFDTWLEHPVTQDPSYRAIFDGVATHHASFGLTDLESPRPSVG